MSKSWSVFILVLQGVTNSVFGAFFATFFKFVKKSAGSNYAARTMLNYSMLLFYR